MPKDKAGKSQSENQLPQQFSKWNNYLETKKFLKSWKEPFTKKYPELETNLSKRSTTPEQAIKYISDFKKEYETEIAKLGKSICNYGLPYQAILRESYQGIEITDGIKELISWLIEHESSINERLASYQKYTASGLLMLLSLWRDPKALPLLETQLRYVVKSFQTTAQLSLTKEHNEGLKKLLSTVEKSLKNNKNLLITLTEILQAIAHTPDYAAKPIKNFRDELLAIAQIIIPYDYQYEDMEVSFTAFFVNHPLLSDHTEFNKKIDRNILALWKSTPQGQTVELTQAALLNLELPPDIIDISLDYVGPYSIFNIPQKQAPESKPSFTDRLYSSFNFSFLSSGIPKKADHKHAKKPENSQRSSAPAFDKL